MNNSLSYSVRIWLTSAFIPPLLFFSFFIGHEINRFLELVEFIPYYFIFVFASIVISGIPFLFFKSINNLLFLKIKDPIQLKITINLQAIFWGLLPFLIFFWKEIKRITIYGLDDDILYIFLSYIVVISASIWYFKIERDEALFNNEIQDDLLDDDFNFKK